MANVDVAWVQGYLSRATWQYPGDMLNGRDAGAIKGWLDLFCSAHPLETLYVAAARLEAELGKGTEKQREAP